MDNKGLRMPVFKQDDPKNLGRPLYWHLDEHIKAIEGMIRADEIQIAIKMCDNVPGWYRENYPPELSAIKQTLYKNTYDQIEYATDDEEANCTREFGEAQWDNGYMFPRAEIMAELVKSINKTQDPPTPWIFDLGCSHGNLPLGLIREGLHFSYKGVGMNSRILAKVKDWIERHWYDKPTASQPKILYCTEVLEHCFNPMDIVHTAYKQGIEWDYIVLSVPYGTMGGGLPDWTTRRIGHVRTYTQKEFCTFADTHWPGYQWTLTVSTSMVLLGTKKP